MATNTRLYHVKLHGKDHLVDASNKFAAARHIMEAHGSVKIASQRDLITLVSAGVSVETAGAHAE